NGNGFGGGGTVYHITSSGQFTVQYYFTTRFNNFGFGCHPACALVRTTDGSLLGTTLDSFGGTTFTLSHDPANGLFDIIRSAYTFTIPIAPGGGDGVSPDGAYSVASPTLGPDGSYYGIADYGGTVGF